MESLEHFRGDSRLFFGAATWLKVYGVLVDGHQLVRILEDRESAPSSAILGALLTASASPHLKGLLARCQPLPQEEILFEVMATNPILRSKVEAGALPEIRRWGLLVEDLTLKPDALRPGSWVLRMNPPLQVRALLGANLRAAVLNRLLETPTPPSISQLVRELGRSYPSVHAAVGALLAGGSLPTPRLWRANGGKKRQPERCLRTPRGELPQDGPDSGIFQRGPIPGLPTVPIPESPQNCSACRDAGFQ